MENANWITHYDEGFMKQVVKELIPFIISAAEVAAEKCNCLPEDILLATNEFIKSRGEKHPNQEVEHKQAGYCAVYRCVGKRRPSLCIGCEMLVTPED